MSKIVGDTPIKMFDKIVIIGFSEGGLEPVRDLLSLLRIPCTAAFFIVSHIGPHKSHLPYLLSRSSSLPVVFAKHYSPILGGHIYVAPPDNHVVVTETHMLLSQGPKVHYTRPAVDPLFESAASIHKDKVIGVILSGGDGDGALGLKIIKQHGGLSFVQLPNDAQIPSMPNTAIAKNHPESLPISDIAHRLQEELSSSR